MSSKTAEKYGKRLEHANRELKCVRIGQMKVCPMAQRELRPGWVADIASSMNIDMLGTPELSYRDGHFFIIDAQHRIEAIKKWNGPGWENVALDCWVWTGLTEKDEAEMFLELNHKLNVNVFENFKIALQAGRQTETNIACIVQNQNLVVSKQETPGAVRAVGTLIKVYKRDGGDSLGRALAMARDAFGDPGFEATVIDGFGQVCQRYNGVLDPRGAIASLRKMNGGVKGLLCMAAKLREKTGNPKAQCLAAATVTVINRDRSPKTKLASWFKE